ncbi:MAG: ribose ABC transporter [Chloroflexi bacterium]|nr:ribose ABC transporter [Chloroflexota bacterium]MBV9544271.1 ribose ABC transporter [Chloroflexota bacterium]
METGGAAEVPQSEPEPESARNRLFDTAERFWSWLFLLALLVIFSIFGRGFFDLFNFQSILANAAIGMIMALGLTFVIIAGGIDLSVAYVMGLASVMSAIAMRTLGAQAPLFVVVLAGLAVGLLAGAVSGLVNGILVARFRVPPFIGTLGTYGVAQGAAFLLSGGQPVTVQINGLGQIGNGSLLYFHPSTGFTFFNQPPGLSGAELRSIVSILPHPLTLMIVMIAISWWLLARSRFGQHTYAIGGNTEAALRAGVPVRRHTILIYLLSAEFAALAGVLYTTRFTNGAAPAGEPLLLNAIAAVVIGGVSLFGGAGTITGTVIGGLIIAVIQNGLVIMAINPFWQYISVGVVIILAVLVDQAKARIAQ